MDNLIFELIEQKQSKFYIQIEKAALYSNTKLYSLFSAIYYSEV
jgi:hypothetical protein